MNKKKIAIVYDADNTILKEDHPNLILRARGMDVDGFWKQVDEIQDRHKAEHPDSNVDGFYLNYMAKKSRDPNHPLYGLTIKEMQDIAKRDMPSLYYSGIPEFFDRIKKENPDCDITHHIISLGIGHMLEAGLGQYVDRIFAYTFTTDPDDGGLIVAGTNSSLEKDSATKKVSRGRLFGTDEKGFEYPMKEMIAIGDGFSDKEMFRQVGPRGLAICVFDPWKDLSSGRKARELADKIGNVYTAITDYTPSHEINRLTSKFIRGAEK